MGKTKDSWARIAGHKPSSITANSRMHHNLWDVVGSHLSPKLFMPNPFFVGLKEESVVSHSTDMRDNVCKGNCKRFCSFNAEYSFILNGPVARLRLAWSPQSEALPKSE